MARVKWALRVPLEAWTNGGIAAWRLGARPSSTHPAELVTLGGKQHDGGSQHGDHGGDQEGQGGDGGGGGGAVLGHKAPVGVLALHVHPVLPVVCRRRGDGMRAGQEARQQQAAGWGSKEAGGGGRAWPPQDGATAQRQPGRRCGEQALEAVNRNVSNFVSINGAPLAVPTTRRFSAPYCSLVILPLSSRRPYLASYSSSASEVDRT